MSEALKLDYDELKKKAEIKQLLIQKGELNEIEAAYFLDLENIHKLRSWRCVGKGPDFIKQGHDIRYTVDALRRFLEDNTISPRNQTRAMTMSPVRRGRKPSIG